MPLPPPQSAYKAQLGLWFLNSAYRRFVSARGRPGLDHGAHLYPLAPMTYRNSNGRTPNCSRCSAPWPPLESPLRWLVAIAAAAGLAGPALSAPTTSAGASVPAPAQAAAPSVAPTQTQLEPSQIALLEDALAKAPNHGFAQAAFTTQGLDDLLSSSDAAARQAGQQKLIAAVMRYAKAVHTGRLTEAGFLEEWGLRPAPYDPMPDFNQAVIQDKLGPWLDSLPPPYTGYQSLTQGLTAYRTIAAKGGWKPISPGPALKLGSDSPRVMELRARLAAEDPTVTADGPTAFDDALAKGVMRAQKRFGLKDDGVADSATLAALNTPLDDRISQIVANLERWRWLPAELPVDRIQVNIAAAILTVFHADAPTLSMRAVTGRPGDETPMLHSQVQSIVFNPPWNVPSSIATKELWPKEKAHPGYFAKHDFIVITTPDGGKRLQQKAGDQAALGKFKFDFPNPYGVYLHDTPTQSTFSRFSRLSSHGCVRLQHPLILANALQQGDQTWTPETVDATLATGKTVRAALTQPVAVFLFYWTAYLGTDGMMNFRSDPYGWDATLMQRLRTPSGAV